MPEIGDILREARMRAKIDISEVEAETKIRAKYLRALENEEWGLLPGSTFVKTFLRTYAEYLGLDGRLLIEEYKSRYEPMSSAEMAPFTPALGERPRERFRPRGGPSRGAVVGAILVALVALLFLLGKIFPDSNGGGSDNTVAGTKTPAKHRRAAKKPASAAPAKPKRTRVKLQVVPTGPVWVCLEDGSGNRLIGGTLIDPGTPRKTYSAKKFRITLGNSQVSMKVDGRTLRVPARPGPVAYVLTPRGRTELPSGKQPTCA